MAETQKGSDSLDGEISAKVLVLNPLGEIALVDGPTDSEITGLPSVPLSPSEMSAREIREHIASAIGVSNVDFLGIDEEAGERFYLARGDFFPKGIDGARISWLSLQELLEMVDSGILESSRKLDLLKRAKAAIAVKTRRAVRNVDPAKSVDIVDVRHPEYLPKAELKKFFQKAFGSPEKTENLRSFVDCIKVALEYLQNHCKESLSSDLVTRLGIIHQPDCSPEDLKKFTEAFISGFGIDDPRVINDVRQLAIVAAKYRDILTHKPDFTQKIQGIDDAFNQVFSDNFLVRRGGKKHYRVKGRGKGGNEISLSNKSHCPSAKSLFRILDKLITKPNTAFEDVKDILRFQLVLINPDDFNRVVRAIREAYPKAGLREKSSKNRHRGEGISDNVTWLIGEFQGYPVEIRIVKNEAAYFEMNSESKVHGLFELIKTKGLRETKLGLTGIEKNTLEAEMERLAKEPSVQSIVNATKSKKDLKKQARSIRSHSNIENTKKKLMERWKQFYFPCGEYWFPYEEVFRQWQSPLFNEFETVAQSMFKHLNQRASTAYSPEEWKSFFEEPEAFMKGMRRHAKKDVYTRFENVVTNLPGFDINQGVKIAA